MPPGSAAGGGGGVETGAGVTRGRAGVGRVDLEAGVDLTDCGAAGDGWTTGALVSQKTSVT